MRADITDGLEPWVTMWNDRHPPQPNFAKLVARGFADFAAKGGMSVQFTTEGLTKLREVCEPCRVR